MKIGFDLSIIRMNQAGAAVYAQSLFDALQEINTEHLWCTFSTNLRRELGKPKTIASRIHSLRHDLLWHNVTLPWQAHRAGIDILHSPAYITPLVASCPVVVSILDVLPIKTPETFPRWQRTYNRMFLPFLSRRATAIITISEQSKRDIIQYLHIAPENVFVTYLAASPAFRPLSLPETDAIKARYSLDQFVFCVGTLEPRKNITRAIQAFSCLKQAGYPHKFVHAGSKGWLYDDILAEVENFGLQKDVIFLGKVPQNDLISLYNAASLFVYPSLHEGFGIPPLEAMACGTPVITSNVSSLPEVVGDAGMLIDPYDAQAIFTAMQSLIDDKSLHSKLCEDGLRRSQMFSWQRCAQETLQVYESLL